MTYRVMVRSNNGTAWEHYGDCTEQELRREIGNIRYLGLYVKVGSEKGALSPFSAGSAGLDASDPATPRGAFGKIPRSHNKRPA